MKKKEKETIAKTFVTNPIKTAFNLSIEHILLYPINKIIIEEVKIDGGIFDGEWKGEEKINE